MAYREFNRERTPRSHSGGQTGESAPGRVPPALVQGRSGSCLQLWKRGDIRSALWETRKPQGGWRAPVYPALRPVRLGQLDQDELEALRLVSVGSSPDITPHAIDPLMDAWCGLVQEHMSGEGDCFFTGTYSDGYGYPHGLMKARNVLKDFERLLSIADLADKSWVCCVELHKFRDILHLHALISGVGEFQDRVRLEQLWRSSGRGQQVTAAPLLDRGIGYCTKYALKGQDAAMFDWSFA